MKTKQLLILIAGALATLSNTAKAEQITSNQFTPIDKLDAEQRSKVIEQVQRTLPADQIDWQNNILGVNGEGKIEIRDRSTLKINAIVDHSCFGS